MRKMYLHPLKTTLALTAGLLALSSMSWGNPASLGTTSLAFDNNGFSNADFGSVTGNFAINAGTNSVTSWDLKLSTGQAGGSTDEFNSADTAAAASVFVTTDANGNQVIDFFQAFATVDELQIVVACAGTQNCLTQAANGMSFNLVTGACSVSAVCGNSGLFLGVPDLFQEFMLAPGALNVTDPPGTLAFNIATTATGPIFGSSGSGGTGNNGGGTGVPEPGTLSLIVPGLAAFGLKLRKKMAVRTF